MTTSERLRIVASYCRGLEVLDIGSGEHATDRIGGEDWLHDLLCRVAGKVVGIELVPELVQTMKERGYDVVLGDAETFNLAQKFDVVVAGELIEHVGNQLNVLINLRRHLKDGGRLIITTPNALSWRYAGYALLVGRFNPNVEHTLWHDESTLREIVRRAGFETETVYHVMITPLDGRRWDQLCHLVDRILTPIRPRLVPQLIMICRLKGRSRTAGSESQVEMPMVASDPESSEESSTGTR